MDNQYKPMKPEKYMEDLNKFLIEKRKVTLTENPTPSTSPSPKPTLAQVLALELILTDAPTTTYQDGARIPESQVSLRSLLQKERRKRT